MGKKRSRVVYLLVILVLTILILTIIIFTYLGTEDLTRVPGVTLGDTFTFDVTSFWNSIDPNATVLQRLVEINQTESFRVTISNVSEALVSTLDTWIFENGTQRNSTGLVNVETGFSFGGFWPVVAANLGKNDLLHPAGQNGITVNGTIIRQYSSGPRETNYFIYNYQGVDENYGYYTAEAEYYFDRETGMLVELYDKSAFVNPRMDGAILWKIKDSNVWVIPEFPSVLILPLLMIITSLAVIAYKKKCPGST